VVFEVEMVVFELHEGMEFINGEWSEVPIYRWIAHDLYKNKTVATFIANKKRFLELSVRKC